MHRLFGTAEPLSPAEVFAHLPPLETPRLTLRRLSMRDAMDIFSYARDPQVARHVLWDAHRSVGDSKAYLRYCIHQYHEGQPSSYAIVLKETGRVIGTIGFMTFSQDNSLTEIGYSLARSHWNQGYASEALRAVIDMAFTRLKVHRVEAMHETTNPASGRVMQKCGMQCEGTMRGRIFNKGKYSDVVMYGILREEWDMLKLNK